MILTDDECDLLGHPRLATIIASAIANPDDCRYRLPGSGRGGGNHSFGYDVSRTHLTGNWTRSEVVEWFGPDSAEHVRGKPRRYAIAKPHRNVSITLRRLQKWCESIPDDLRKRIQVAHHHREYRSLVTEAVALSRSTPGAA